MTRRGFLALPAVAAPRESPRNIVANRGNEFIAEWGVWANQLNSTPPGSINYDAINSFGALQALFRRLEHAWKDYIRK